MRIEYTARYLQCGIPTLKQIAAARAPVAPPAAAPQLKPQTARQPAYRKPQLRFLGSNAVEVNGEVAMVDEVSYWKDPIRRDVLEFMAKNGNPRAIAILERESSAAKSKTRIRPEDIAKIRDPIIKRDQARYAVLDLIRINNIEDGKKIYLALVAADVSRIDDVKSALQILDWMKEYHEPNIEKVGQYSLLKRKLESDYLEEPEYQIERIYKKPIRRNSIGGGIFVRQSDGYHSGYPVLEE